MIGIGQPLAHGDDGFQLLLSRDHRKNGCRFERPGLVGHTEVGTPGPCHRGSYIVDVRQRADDNIRPLRLETLATLICSMHQGGDGKAFL